MWVRQFSRGRGRGQGRGRGRGSIDDGPNGKPDPENIGISFGILLISCLGVELHAFVVWRRHLGLSTSGLVVSGRPTVSALVRWNAGPKNHRGSQC